jgi:hypothetical protein
MAFEIVVIIIFQIIFYLKIIKNNIFLSLNSVDQNKLKI